jgi:hypothetical protein
MPDSDQERWLTYVELGSLLKCSASAARMHAKRRGWARRSPNRIGDLARVLVPPDTGCALNGSTDVQRTGSEPFAELRDERDSERVRRTFDELIAAIAELREALGDERAAHAAERVRLASERERSTHAEARLGELLAELCDTRVELADAQAAARISTDAVAALNQQLDSLVKKLRRPWWRRWFR